MPPQHIGKTRAELLWALLVVVLFPALCSVTESVSEDFNYGWLCHMEDLKDIWSSFFVFCCWSRFYLI